MKKLVLICAIVMCYCAIGRAGDIFTATLLDHVGPVTQFQNGKTKLALVDSVIQIGNSFDRSIFDIQVGFNGNTKPQSDEVTSADLIAGGFLKVSSLLWTKIAYPQEWEFLRAVEHGPFMFYDFRAKEWHGGYQVGLAFDLNPTK